MDLWTEFEGVTIDSAYSLNKLLQTEGRSAFFSTLNARGEAVLIRIIECHFDEDEILARWRGVQSLGHPNFLRIDRFGQFLIEADGITAVYAVFERVDANLGQVLEQGCLPTADAAQIGLSIASALDTLHTHGFVHEHVEPANIYAVGETVKLRSDCIRETREGEAGAAARQRDIHDLALVLMQVLLGSPRTSAPHRPAALPAPFETIVQKGISGEWGLADIQAELQTLLAPDRSAKKLPPRPAPVSPSPAIPTVDTANALPEFHEPAGLPVSSERPIRPQPRFDPLQPRMTSSKPEAHIPFPGPDDTPFNLSDWLTNFLRDPRQWAIAGGVFVGVMLLAWLLLHGASPHAKTVAPSAQPDHAATGSSPASPATPAASSALPAPKTATPASGARPWRVVAFTYNHKDQAQKKAATVAQKHPELQPEVFSPNGRSPWLVTIGGALQRDDAYALARKAQSIGLPRDTYAQNYTAR